MKYIEQEGYMSRLGLAYTEDIGEVSAALLGVTSTYSTSDLVPIVAAATILLLWYDPADLYSIIRYPRDPTRKEIEEADRVVYHLRSRVMGGDHV